MFRMVFFIAAYATCKINTASADVTVSDPCVPDNYRNITHLYERYSKLEGDCPYTDSRIENAWFYAGNDAIVTSPPDFCACGYRFPIWMNGTLPTPDEGVANRTACVKFTKPCYRSLQIQLKNCGTFFVYHLSPTLDDSGYCFGVNKPGAESSTQHPERIPNANIAIQESTITSNSFITVINISVISTNVSVALFHEDGSVVKSLQLDKSVLVYKWANLNPATNYSVQINVVVRGESRILATTWALTKPFQKPTAVIELARASISTQSLSISVKYDHGSDNITAEGAFRVQNGSLVMTFQVLKPSLTLTFENLTTGTRYAVSVYVDRRTGPVVLDELLVFTKPDIQAHIGSVTAGNDVQRNTTFRCVFQPSLDKFYTVLWTVERAEKSVTIYKKSDGVHGILDLQLTEADILKYNFYVPFNVSCAVAENDGTISDTEFSVASDSLFAGIKILTPQLTMYRNETILIQFQQTVPSGCYTNHNGAICCNLTIAVSVPVKKTCTGISTRSCTIQVHGNTEQNLEIQATEDGQYGVLKETTHDVILRTEPLEHSIWSNYVLPSVKVTVLPEKDTYWRSKRCEALNDPHMYTFDAMPYEHHESMSEEYVMYTHTSFNAKIHHKLERCNTNAMCNCGVAVQAGRDIYLISTCNNILEIGYKQCDDGVLLVKQETDTKYTIYFPYGTSVTARLDKTPYSNSAGSLIVSVSVFPSVHDQQGRSRGLCGTLDNNPSNDFHGRSGELRLNRTEFIQAWRVSKEESLFKANVKSTTAWVHPACTCDTKSDDVTSEEKCQLGADNSCSKGRTVGQQTCKMAEKTNIGKPAEKVIPTFDLNTKGNHSYSVTTRSPLPTTTHWNHTKAKAFCTTYMETSRAYRLCARVPYTDTKRSVETCTQDIVLTETTEWHRISRRSMQDSCVSEIYRNKTVRDDLERPTSQSSTTSGTRHTPVSTPKGQHMERNATVTPTSFISDSNLDMLQLIATIEEIACPNECSDRGICTKGVCICEAGYGSYDCSIDFSKPPLTASLLYGTLCDENNAACTHVYIHGGFFATESVRCHITTFETLSITKGRQNMDAYVLPGQAQSLIEVICPLRPKRYARSIPDVHDVRLISCFQVSVSNDGIHHGLPLEMCVYNSKCQKISNRTDGTLTAMIKVGFCFIGGECIPSGMIKPGDNTYCDPNISPYQWSVGSSSTVLAVTETTSDIIVAHVEEKHSWMVPVVAASSCICIICIAIVLVMCLWKRKKSCRGSKESEKNDVIVSYTRDLDSDEETYAYIKHKDINDDLPYVKASTPDDYTRLDINSRENANYSKLNGIMNMRSDEKPALPERYNSHQVYDRPPLQDDPYQKLNLDKRFEKDYDKLTTPDEDYLAPTVKSNINT